MQPTYLHLSPNQALPELAGGPFAAVIVAEMKVAAEWRNLVTKWLVERGCLYAVSWGVDCEEWHDAVDWAVLEEFDFGDVPNDRFVMTTWHDGEPLSKAFWYAGNCASHPDVDLTAAIILHISDEARSAAMLETYRESQRLPDNK